MNLLGRASNLKFILVLNLLITGVISPDAFAGPTGASLSPTRVVISDNQKSASVTLRNTSDTEIAYRMNLVEMGLDDDGAFTILDDNQLHSRHNSAKPIIRFSPRQVRLKPGASQVVRVIVRRRGLSDGEYRSHMMISALPVLSGLGIDSGTGENPVLVQSASSASVGVTIPVIVRNGETDSSVTVENSVVIFNESGAGGRVDLQLGLHGNRSAYGDIVVSLIDNGKEKTIAVLKSFALYFPYPRETVSILLRKNIQRTDFSSEPTIRIKFKNKAKDSSKKYWLDKIVVPTLG